MGRAHTCALARTMRDENRRFLICHCEERLEEECYSNPALSDAAISVSCAQSISGIVPLS